MPGHDTLTRQGAAGGVLIVPHRGGQQLDAWSPPRNGAQVVLRLGGANSLEVDDQARLAAAPHLIVALPENGRTPLRQLRIGPVAPACDGLALLWPHPPAEPGTELSGRGLQPRGRELADGALDMLPRRRAL